MTNHLWFHENAAAKLDVDFDPEGSWTEPLGASEVAHWAGGATGLCVALFTVGVDNAWLVTVGNNAHRYRARFLFECAADALSTCAKLRGLAAM